MRKAVEETLKYRRGEIGGRSRDRTYDLTIKSRLLYQLSYAPIERKTMELFYKPDTL
jgi:hypothetical protein